MGILFVVGLGPTMEWFPQADRANANLPRRGVSLAGGAFGTHRPGFCNENPGQYETDYTYNQEHSVKNLCEKGLGLLRIPFRWERIQPQLGKPLDPQELQRLKTVVSWARKHKGDVILDVHNYGRYFLRHKGRIHEAVIDESIGGEVLVSRDHFADLWRRLSLEFAKEPTIWAYGLMNEPHDMGKSDWKAISQSAVDAIRKNGDKKLLLVAGNGWSNAHRFAEVNGAKAWIKDAANHHAYEAHCYFDHDFSGQYQKSFDEERKRDGDLRARGVERLMPFVNWCQVNDVRGFLGEYGVPNNDPRWEKVLTPFLKAMDNAKMDSCAWAAGEWWGDYPLLVKPEMIAR